MRHVPPAIPQYLTNIFVNSIVSIRLSASGAVHRDYLKTRDVVTYFEPGTAFKYIESFTTRTRPLPAEVEDPPSLLYTNVKPFERFTSIIGSSYHNRAKFEVGSTFTSERARGLVFGLLREFEIRAADLRSELNETIDIIQGLKTRMAELETRMAESETRGDELETSAAAAETRAARAEERVAELEAEVERMNIEEMDVDAGGEGEGDGDEEFGGVEQRSRVVEEREQDEVQEYDAGEQEGGNYLGFDDGKGVADVSGDDAGDVSMIAIQGTPDRPHFIGSPPVSSYSRHSDVSLLVHCNELTSTR
jgi:uncharacterized coiled-coil protein SlyX